VQCVQLVLVFYPLGQDAARAAEQVLNLGLGGLGSMCS
jgi:D-arabinose 1-dehydrogenase-like Zn-dependent alcohol dehydrogenase